MAKKMEVINMGFIMYIIGAVFGIFAFNGIRKIRNFKNKPNFFVEKFILLCEVD